MDELKKFKKQQRRHAKSRINAAMREFIDNLSGDHRLHLSKKKIDRLEVEYPPDLHNDKPTLYSLEKKEPLPTGFWWGFDGSWADWCLTAQYRGGERYFYKLDLDQAAILTISNLRQFEAFEDAYAGHSLWEEIEGLQLRMGQALARVRAHPVLNRRPYYVRYINWPKVAENYAGVEINPYLYQKRLEAFWYYGWDCSSGVVWDIAAVKEFRPFAIYNSQTGRFELQGA